MVGLEIVEVAGEVVGDDGSEGGVGEAWVEGEGLFEGVPVVEAEGGFRGRGGG